MPRVIWIIASLAAIFLLVGAQSATAQSSHKISPADRAELRMILLQARDGVIQVAASDLASYDTSIADRVHQLVDWFLFIGDRQDVRYLQRHLRETYAEEIVHVLEPEIKLSDEQAIARAGRLKNSKDRMRAFARIAIQQFSRGKTKQAQQAVDLAIKAGLEPIDKPDLLDAWPGQMLLDLSILLRSSGYEDAADKAFARAGDLLSSSSNADPGWEEFAEEAIDRGNLELARNATEKISDVERRNSVDLQYRAAVARRLDPAAAIEAAKALGNIDDQVDTLCAVADRQISAGDQRGAESTLQVALKAVLEGKDLQFQVLLLNDIAWQQIIAGDFQDAERTLETALKSNELDRPGSDQNNGWMSVAESYALLGNFEKARRIAGMSKTPDARGRALRIVAKRETAAGHKTDALAWANLLKDPDERSSAFLGIAEAMIEQLRGQ